MDAQWILKGCSMVAHWNHQASLLIFYYRIFPLLRSLLKSSAKIQKKFYICKFLIQNSAIKNGKIFRRLPRSSITAHSISSVETKYIPSPDKKSGLYNLLLEGVRAKRDKNTREEVAIQKGQQIAVLLSRRVTNYRTDFFRTCK